ncbi:Predicted metal-dependent peptidase [Loktanella fryxellensis]|uniref:Predicted metal-dependent peptidase n=1 Tax=Loktanella fryxellensis TaxID=245187 RepID=A0A1H8EF00_9RHOB|nr:VWA-like domain-containing protein [Loktanella fryxellensis]SEN18053.1 Predicted metal-dependent peptidase [Loktanella fryxellensis]
MTVHSRRATPALTALAEADPTLAALALWCDHRDGAATATAGAVITYGPEFEALAPHEQIGLAAHHILHVALRHSARLADLQERHGGALRADLYNLAADALINQALLAADYALPRPAVTLTGLLRDGLGQPDASLADWDVERLYFALLPRSGDGDGDDKAADYARAQGFAPDLDAADGKGASDDPNGDAARWQQHLARAIAAGQAAGRGIGAGLRHLADFPDPQTPWPLILRRALAQATMPQRTPTPQRPARAWIAGLAQAQATGTPTPAFQPGMRPLTEIPRICIGLDASGSIDDGRLALFWAEVTGIARRMRVDLHVAVFDDGIRHIARIAPGDPRPRMPDLPQGGGTDFAPVIRHAVAMQASALVMLTDLDGHFGPAPRVPVIWAVPDAHGLTAPFGRLIDLSR